MEEQFYTILTKIGKAKIANTSVLGTKVKLSKFLLGDSNGKYYNPTEEQKELRHKVWEGGINSFTIHPDNSNWMIVTTVIPSNVGNFTIREIGICDDENNLIAIGKYPESYKPIADNGATKELKVNMILEVSNATNVNLSVDPTVIVATKKDILNLDNKINNIKIPVTSVNSKTGEIDLTAADIKAKDGKNLEEFKKETESQWAETAKQLEDIKKDEYATISTQDYIKSLPNSVDGYLDVELEGNTLVNLLGNQGTATFTHTGTPQTIRKLTGLNLKANTTYTMFLNVTNFKGTTTLKVTNYTNLNQIVGLDYSVINKSDQYRIPFTNSSSIKDIWLYFIGDTDGICDTSDIMILEGDYTNKPLPSYFEGIKSMDSCSIKSVGKNLLDHKKIESVYEDVKVDILETGFIVSNSENVAYKSAKVPVYLQAGWTYKFNYNFKVVDGSQGVDLILNKTFIEFLTPGSSFSPKNSGVYHLVFYSTRTAPALGKVEYTDIMLCVSQANNSYEPFKQHKIDILTQLARDKALKRLPNGTADTLNYNGVLTRRIGKTILDGSENGWIIGGTTSGTTVNTARFDLPITDMRSFTASQTNSIDAFVTDLLYRKVIVDKIYSEDAEGVGVYNSRFCIRIVKSKLVPYGLVEGTWETYITAFKAWLQANPTTACYELAEPTQEQLQPLNLQSFNGGTLIIDSPIPPYANIKYPINIGGAVSSLSNAVNNVENRTGKLEEGLFVTTAKTIELDTKYDELFQSANNVKTLVANAVTNKGVSASPTDTGAVLAEKIGQIVTGKGYKVGSGTSTTPSEPFRADVYNLNINPELDFDPGFIVVIVRNIIENGRNSDMLYVSYPTLVWSKAGGILGENEFSNAAKAHYILSAYAKDVSTTMQLMSTPNRTQINIGIYSNIKEFPKSNTINYTWIAFE